MRVQRRRRGNKARASERARAQMATSGCLMRTHRLALDCKRSQQLARQLARASSAKVYPLNVREILRAMSLCRCCCCLHRSTNDGNDCNSDDDDRVCMSQCVYLFHLQQTCMRLARLHLARLSPSPPPLQLCDESTRHSSLNPTSTRCWNGCAGRRQSSAAKTTTATNERVSDKTLVVVVARAQPLNRK